MPAYAESQLKMKTRIRNNCRKIHIENKVWQYRRGRKFITIYSPQNKRHNIPCEDFFIFIYGSREIYEKRLNDTMKWGFYAWDSPSVMPSDFDLKIIEFKPVDVKKYIEGQM